MKKVLITFGTRPEAIKLAPLVKGLLNERKEFEVKVCLTSQHVEMLNQMLDFFEIDSDYNLDLMKSNQTLNEVWASILINMQPVLDEWKPDWMLVQGDTATCAAAALCAYFAGCRLGHVEAGLRTWNKWSPFPEEINRQITGRIADCHFAPTELSRQNLLKEAVPEENIYVTGNTVIDALLDSVKKVNSGYLNEEIKYLSENLDPHKKIILVTAHRRESFGEGFINICEALKEVAEKNNNLQIVYPVHLNPNVQTPVKKILSNIPNIRLISPLSYPSFVWLMNRSHLIITDSGGVQEEAPSLGKPVIVMRDVTERTEAVDAGTVKLVGTDRSKIVDEAECLLNDQSHYKQMSEIQNPYGDGNACSRIINILKGL